MKPCATVLAGCLRHIQGAVCGNDQIGVNGRVNGIGRNTDAAGEMSIELLTREASSTPPHGDEAVRQR